MQPLEPIEFEDVRSSKQNVTMLFALIALFFVFLLVFGYFYFFVSHIDTFRRKQKELYAVLVLTDDNRIPYAGFAITFVPATRRYAAIALPIHMLFPAGESDARYTLAQHYERGGMGACYHAIESAFHISARYTMSISYKGLENIIDLVGGIKLYVEEEVAYTNKQDSVFLHFPPGGYTVHGEKAVNFIRYTETNSLYPIRERLYRVEDIFLNMFIAFIEQPTLRTIYGTSAFRKILAQQIGGNVRAIDFAAMRKDVLNLRPDSLVIEDMNGTPYSNDTRFLVPSHDGAYAIAHIKRLRDWALRDPKKDEVKKRDIDISVRNATDIKGLADRTKVRLSRKGFNALDVGNFPYTMPLSAVLLRRGNPIEAMLTSEGADISRVYAKTARPLDRDVTLVLGFDYDDRKK